MTGHTPWSEIKKKGKPRKRTAVSLTVYDLNGDAIDPALAEQLAAAILPLVKRYPALAIDVSVE